MEQEQNQSHNQSQERKSPITDSTSQSSQSPQLYSQIVQSSPSKSLPKGMSPFQAEWLSDLYYSPGTIIGRGSFGQVFKATHKQTDHVYALKIIDKALIDSPTSLSIINREIDIMTHLNHPNIIRLLNHYEDNNSIYLLMPFIPHGQLYKEIQKTKVLNDRLVAHYALDVIDAVCYLHSRKPKIIHRDIKPENILIDENKQAILTDFGTGNYIDEGQMRRTNCGSPEYLAPEIVKGYQYDEKVDIWSIGVLLYEMLTGSTPFHGDTLPDTKENISRLRINWPHDISPLARNLISKILKLDPKERLTIEQIKSHPFFSKETKQSKRSRDRDRDRVKAYNAINEEENALGEGLGMGVESFSNTANFVRSLNRKESLSLFHKKSFDESFHPLINHIKSELDISNKEIHKLKAQIHRLQSTNEQLMTLNNTLMSENNSITESNVTLTNERHALLTSIDELNNTIHQRELSILSLQSEFALKESKMNQEHLALASEYKHLSSLYNELKSCYANQSSIKANFYIEDFQLELLSPLSTKGYQGKAQLQLKEIELMLKNLKDNMTSIISSNCNEVKAINTFYKDNTKYIRQCYLNTFTSLTTLIYQMDNDVKKTIESTVVNVSEHQMETMNKRLQWLTEQNEALMRTKVELNGKEVLIERLESEKGVLREKNTLLQKELDVYMSLIGQLEEKIIDLSNELLDMQMMN